jgi:ATP-dependent HslUV protease ATP-binding subunit HslU
VQDIELDKMVGNEDVTREAVKLAEQDGIVVIDEIDKICSPKHARDGKDASSEGVQVSA